MTTAGRHYYCATLKDFATNLPILTQYEVELEADVTADGDKLTLHVTNAYVDNHNLRLGDSLSCLIYVRIALEAELEFERGGDLFDLIKAAEGWSFEQEMGEPMGTGQWVRR